MARTYYEYEVRKVSSDELVETLYISEITESQGWVLGQWYRDSDTGDIKTEIRSEDGELVATYVTSHYDPEGGDLF